MYKISMMYMSICFYIVVVLDILAGDPGINVVFFKAYSAGCSSHGFANFG